MSVAVVGVVFAGGLGSPSGASEVSLVTHGHPVAPLNCRSSFNPYAHARAAVSACGYKTFPRIAVHALPGGGASYVYLVNGHRVTFYVPPKGFDPSTATNAELSEYGFPARPAVGARPAAASAARTWAAQMRGWRGAAKPPSFLAETHTSADSCAVVDCDSNWAGYALPGVRDSFRTVEAWYIEPTIYGSSCSETGEGTWAGVGGLFPGDPLAQDGTGYGLPGLAAHQAWWEIVPDDPDEIPVNLFGHPGYEFAAKVNWTLLGWAFYLYDYYSGLSVSVSVESRSFSGDSAEAIIERPTIINPGFPDTLMDLSDFGTLTVLQSQANYTDFGAYPGETPRGYEIVDTSNDDMADPSAIGSGGSFTVTQHLCS